MPLGHLGTLPLPQLRGSPPKTPVSPSLCLCQHEPPGITWGPEQGAEPTVEQGVSPQASSPHCTPGDSTGSGYRGNFPLLMLKRKFHFPVSDEHFPFGLKKPLPPQHPVEGCTCAEEASAFLLASVFLFLPKIRHPPSWHLCGIACTSSREAPCLTGAISIGATWFFLNFLGVNN